MLNLYVERRHFHCQNFFFFFYYFFHAILLYLIIQNSDSRFLMLSTLYLDHNWLVLAPVAVINSAFCCCSGNALYILRLHVYFKSARSAQKCPSQAWVLPFKGKVLFTLTSMVMSSITIEVIHMYLSIAMKLFQQLTGLLNIL